MTATATDIFVPLLDLKAQYKTIRPEIEAMLPELLESQWFVLGPNVAALEEEVAACHNVKHAIGCASGSDAVLLMLMAFGIGHGDEVICPTFTFFATGGMVARTGAKPVFCDIDPATYNICPESLREKAASCTNLKAIIPVHLYGQSADMDAVQAVADEFGVPVLEDAAQIIGGVDKHGDRIGSKSLIQGWSFYPTKNVGAFGEAGMVTTNDDDLADTVRKLRVHGGKDRYFHDMVGINSRIDAIQAAVLRVKLPYLEQWNQKRRENAKFYDDAFRTAGARCSRHGWDEETELPLRYPHRASKREHHIYHQYIIRVPADKRDDLKAYLAEHRIGSEVFYPRPLHLQECFSGLGGKEGDLPNAEAAAREVLALPIYPELTTDQLTHVSERIIAFLKP